MQNYKLTITYEGTQYSGWQIQTNGLSIQELIQKALKTILKQDCTLIGSGRTDAGVHALAQVAHFKTDAVINPHRLLLSLNGLLPEDIRILAVENVPMTFHAQKSAVSKIYHYHITRGPVQSPFSRLYSHHVREALDLDAMRKGAHKFIGTHDFTSFANEAHSGAASKNAVRHIYRLDIIEDGNKLRFEFEGNGFLYKMVRNIVGMLVQVGKGKRQVHEIAELMALKDRRKAPMAAPAHGLFLFKVNY